MSKWCKNCNENIIATQAAAHSTEIKCLNLVRTDHFHEEEEERKNKYIA